MWLRSLIVLLTVIHLADALSRKDAAELRRLFRLDVRDWSSDKSDNSKHDELCAFWHREPELSDEEYGRVEFLHSVFSENNRYVDFSVFLNAMELITFLLPMNFKAPLVADMPIRHLLTAFRQKPDELTVLSPRLKRLAAEPLERPDGRLSAWRRAEHWLNDAEYHLRCDSATRLKRRLLYTAVQFVEFVKPPAQEGDDNGVEMMSMNLIDLTSDQAQQFAAVERYVARAVAEKQKRESDAPLTTKLRRRLTNRPRGDSAVVRRPSTAQKN